MESEKPPILFHASRNPNIERFEPRAEKTRELEWTSVETVIPIGKEIVPSALNDMLKHGVQVYFVDKTTFDQIQKTPDHGESIVKSLTPLR